MRRAGSGPAGAASGLAVADLHLQFLDQDQLGCLWPGDGETETDQVGADGKQLRGQPVKDQPATLRARLAQEGVVQTGFDQVLDSPGGGGC